MAGVKREEQQGRLSAGAPPQAAYRYAPPVRPVAFGAHTLEFGGKTHIMGILNVTPDSFSDGGLYYDHEKALAHAREMVADGADVVDLGAESASIKASKPDANEQVARLVPLVRELAAGLGRPLSIDTYQSAVAEATLAAGAAIINDISGLHADPDLARVVAEHGAGLVIMHMKGHPRRPDPEPRYEDVFEEVRAYLSEGVERALAAGVREEKILLDPGIGVGKRTAHNLELLQRLGELRALGFPILLGASRTSVIGNVLELPVGEREEGTLATTAWAAFVGADMVRVHDVRGNARVAAMADALARGIRQPDDGWPFDAVTGEQRRPLRPPGSGERALPRDERG